MDDTKGLGEKQLSTLGGVISVKPTIIINSKREKGREILVISCEHSLVLTFDDDRELALLSVPAQVLGDVLD